MVKSHLQFQSTLNLISQIRWILKSKRIHQIDPDCCAELTIHKAPLATSAEQIRRTNPALGASDKKLLGKSTHYMWRQYSGYKGIDIQADGLKAATLNSASSWHVCSALAMTAGFALLWAHLRCGGNYIYVYIFYVCINLFYMYIICIDVIPI